MILNNCISKEKRHVYVHDVRTENDCTKLFIQFFTANLFYILFVSNS